MLRINRRLFSKSAMKTVLRLEKQDKNWKFDDLQLHSEAFAYGLNSLADNFCDKAQTFKGKFHLKFYFSFLLI